MHVEQSVTQWLRQLKSGDGEAAERLWERYFHKLVCLARRRLGNAPCRGADEEDVAISVFRRLCDGAARGLFTHVESREELWRTLVVMTANRVIDQRRAASAQKRGGGPEPGGFICTEDRLADFDDFIGQEPTPEFIVLLAEEHQRHIDALDNQTLQQVALWKMEGYKNEEIAEQLQVTVRSVERKLQRIRLLWSEMAR